MNTAPGVRSHARDPSWCPSRSLAGDQLATSWRPTGDLATWQPGDHWRHHWRPGLSMRCHPPILLEGILQARWCTCEALPLAPQVSMSKSSGNTSKCHEIPFNTLKYNFLPRGCAPHPAESAPDPHPVTIMHAWSGGPVTAPGGGLQCAERRPRRGIRRAECSLRRNVEIGRVFGEPERGV